MTRARSTTTTNNRRKKVKKLAKGFYVFKHKSFKKAQEQLLSSSRDAYNDRKEKKSFFRKVAIIRLNNASRKYGLNYSQLIRLLDSKQIKLARKQVSEIALNYPDNFEKLINLVRTPS